MRKDDDPQLQLLVDLAKLLRKYGHEAFESLAQSLRDPHVVETLTRILEGTARTARTAKPVSDKTRSASQILQSIAESDPEKHRLLESFQKKFANAEVLPRMQDVREFVQAWKLPNARFSSRTKAMVPLLRLLAELPTDQLIARLSSLPTSTQSSGRDLEGWSKIILDRDRSSNAREKRS